MLAIAILAQFRFRVYFTAFEIKFVQTCLRSVPISSLTTGSCPTFHSISRSPAYCELSSRTSETSKFILSSVSYPQALAGLPVVWYGAVHMDPRQVGAVQRALFNSYPTVTVINIADVIETIQGVVQQIAIVVRFLAAFSILAGAVILASSIASTQFRRVREVVVIKTLGAKRNRIAAVFSVEFLCWGVAGLLGVIFANLLSRVLLHRLDVAFHVEWLAPRWR